MIEHGSDLMAALHGACAGIGCPEGLTIVRASPSSGLHETISVRHGERPTEQYREFEVGWPSETTRAILAWLDEVHEYALRAET